MKKRVLSITLVLCMLLTVLPLSPLKSAAENSTAAAKNITLGYSALHDGDTTNSKWDYVYFGTYSNTPIKWRVLSTKGSSTVTGSGTTDTAKYNTYGGKRYTGDALFMLSENTLGEDVYFGYNNNYNSESCILRNAMGKILSTRSDEYRYVLKTTKKDSEETIAYGTSSNTWLESELRSESFFPLSAREVEQYLGSGKTNANRVSGDKNYYWLRSPGTSDPEDTGNKSGGVANVSSSGWVYKTYANGFGKDGVRPAMNLNLSSVLFTSAGIGGKTSGNDESDGTTGIFENKNYADITGNDGYKLTLLDENRKDFSVSVKSYSGNTVTVSYSGAKTGDNEYISVIIKNGETVKYYGRVAAVTAASGEETFTLPDTFNTDNGDILCVFNEQYNGDKKADFSSDLKVVLENCIINFDANGGIGEMASLSVAPTVSVTIPTAAFTRNGYTFTGWNTKADGTGDDYPVNLQVKNLSTTLYAQWTLTPAEQPTVTKNDLTLDYGSYADKELSVNVSEQQGYTYSYQWYDTAEKKINDATEKKYTVPTDLTVGTHNYYCVVTAKRADNGKTADTKTKVTVTVNKADAALPTPTVQNTITYGATLSTVGLNDGWIWANGNTVPQVNNSGFKAYFYPDDTANYDWEKVDGWNSTEKRVERTVSVTVEKAEQPTPTGLTATDETIDGKSDGKIGGVTEKMEYRKEGSAIYSDINSTEIIGLPDGRYLIRYKADDNHNASEDTTVTVKAGGSLGVTIPQTQVGYTLTADNNAPVWQDSTNLTFTLKDGYSKLDTFAVKVNGNPITLDENGKYTVAGIEENITVTVEGVADITAPDTQITLGNNKWNKFLNTVTFGLFFKDTQKVTVTATDNGSGIDKIYYHLSETALTETQVKALANDKWTEYGGEFSINPQKEFVIYVKASDKTGNVKYISSNGIVLDSIAPSVSGITDGKTYCSAQTVTVSDTHEVTVTVNGKPVTVTNGKFTLSPANGQQTVVATDKAGNESKSITVTVNDGHTYEWKSENGKYWQKCKFCHHETDKKDIPTINVTSNDKACKTHDYTLCFTLPQGVKDPSVKFRYGERLADGTLTINNGVYTSSALSSDYPDKATTFETKITAKTADGFTFTQTKEITIQSQHSGGIATCKNKAVCEICGEEYGKLNPDNHESTKVWSNDSATKHEQKWSCCGLVTVKSENHNWKDGICEDCEYVCKHSGGTATCTKSAKCEICGEDYGKTNNNHDLEHTKATAATVTATGNTEYWHCKACNKYFSDKDGKNSVELKDTVTPKLQPEIINGAGQILTAGEKSELTFRSNAAFSDFLRVEIDGKTVDESNYTKREGSTIVTLNAEYVATLSAGEHQLAIVSEGGTAQTVFTVSEKAASNNTTESNVNGTKNNLSPTTEDSSQIAFFFALLFVSGGVILGTVFYGKKKKHSKK